MLFYALGFFLFHSSTFISTIFLIFFLQFSHLFSLPKQTELLLFHQGFTYRVSLCLQEFLGCYFSSFFPFFEISWLFIFKIKFICSLLFFLGKFLCFPQKRRNENGRFLEHRNFLLDSSLFHLPVNCDFASQPETFCFVFFF